MELILRQKKLIKLLMEEEEFKTVESYAKELGVSSRTVHNDLKAVNSFLIKQELEVRKKPRYGIKIIGSTEKKQKLFMEQNPEEEIMDVFTRRKNVAFHLLKNEQPISFRLLSERYFVSLSSISNDIEQIKSWLEPYLLSIQTNRDGTLITGEEQHIREALKDLIIYEGLNNKGEHSLSVLTPERASQRFTLLAEQVDEFLITKSEAIIRSIEDILNCKFTDNYYHFMVIITTVMLYRIDQKNFVLPTYNRLRSLNDLHALRTYSIVKEVLQEEVSEQVPVEEAVYFSRLIMSMGLESQMTLNVNYNKELNNLTEHLVSLASESLSVDLTTDDLLFKGLLTHLKPMFHRLKNNIIIPNPMLQDIKEQYSAMFGLTWFLGSVIEEGHGYRLNEHEVGYLMVHFQAAIERNQSIKRVVVVCPGGIGTSELIAGRIRRMIPQLEIAGTFSTRELHLVDQNRVDFIISTVPIETAKKPVIQISPVMNTKDAENINRFYFNNFMKKKTTDHGTQNSLIEKILKKENITMEKNLHSQESIIADMCTRLQNKKYVTEEFYTTVIEREKIASTEIGNAVSIPHGNSEHVLKTALSITILDKPIKWGNELVSIIFLIALNKNDQKYTRAILSDLYEILDSEERIERLRQANSKNEVIDIIVNGSEEVD